MLMDGDQQTIQLAKTINMRKQQTLNNVASLHIHASAHVP